MSVAIACGFTLVVSSVAGLLIVLGSNLELTRWGWANFLLFQWTGFRLARVISDDGRLRALAILGPVLPLSGWYGEYVGWPKCRWKIDVTSETPS